MKTPKQINKEFENMLIDKSKQTYKGEKFIAYYWMTKEQNSTQNK